MKKLKLIASILACTIICSGCSNVSAEQESSKSENPRDNVVMVNKVEPDMVECAYSLEELYNKADFIAEVEVKSAETKLFGSIEYTLITPEITTLYKGSYNGEILKLRGGYMKFDEYATGIKESIGINLSDDEKNNGYIYINWCNNYIPEENDKILFFGNTDEREVFEGMYSKTYGSQGLFLIDEENNTLINHSLCINQTFAEPLAQDLIDKYNGVIESNEDYTYVTLTADKNSIIQAIESFE